MPGVRPCSWASRPQPAGQQQRLGCRGGASERVKQGRERGGHLGSPRPARPASVLRASPCWSQNKGFEGGGVHAAACCFLGSSLGGPPGLGVQGPSPAPGPGQLRGPELLGGAGGGGENHSQMGISVGRFRPVLAAIRAKPRHPHLCFKPAPSEGQVQRRQQGGGATAGREGQKSCRRFENCHFKIWGNHSGASRQGQPPADQDRSWWGEARAPRSGALTCAQGTCSFCRERELPGVPFTPADRAGCTPRWVPGLLPNAYTPKSSLSA